MSDSEIKKYVVHCKRELFDIYIGRPSFWGNPFSHLPKSAAEIKVDSREDAIACYEAWLAENPAVVERAKLELRGKVLGCWCHPKPCHGDVLARIANTAWAVGQGDTGKELANDCRDDVAGDSR